MLEYTLLDSSGNPLHSLTQWDVNREITVKGIGAFEKPPDFHFWDKDSHLALVVPSEIVDGGIKAKIPNILLQRHDDIMASIFDVASSGEGKSVAIISVPVVKSKKPQDYNFTENIEYITFTDLVKEAEGIILKLNSEVDQLISSSEQAVKNAEVVAQSVWQDAESGKFDGADGGYYSPSASGKNIHFEPSSLAMPSVPDIPIPGTEGGTYEHDKLRNRNLPDQHPISAITGLQANLDGKQPKGEYLTAESDPTVPDWAKMPQKPRYTAQEIGALPIGTPIPSSLADLTEDALHRTVSDTEKQKWNAPHKDAVTSVNGKTGAVELAAHNLNITSTTQPGKPMDMQTWGTMAEQLLMDFDNRKADKTDIPTKLSELTTDAGNRTVTDTEKAKWNNALEQSGGIMSGAINMGDNKVTGLADPTEGGDAVPRRYVDPALKNYIVAEGTSGGWIYRKWKDGTAECWRSDKRTDVAITNPWGTLYDSGDENTFGSISYPFRFIGQPLEIASAFGTGGALMLAAGHRSSETTSGTYWVVRPNSFTISEVMTSYYVIGRYK